VNGHYGMNRVLLPTIVLLSMIPLTMGCSLLERARGTEVQIACGDNLLKNPSFELGDFVGSPDDPAIMELTNGSQALSGWGITIENDRIPNPSEMAHLSWILNGNKAALLASEGTHSLLFRIIDNPGSLGGAFVRIDQTLSVPIMSTDRFIFTFDLGRHQPPENLAAGSLDVSLSMSCPAAGIGLLIASIPLPTSGPDWQPQVLSFTPGPPFSALSPECPLTLNLAFTEPALISGARRLYINLDNLSLKRLRSVGDCLAAQ